MKSLLASLQEYFTCYCGAKDPGGVEDQRLKAERTAVEKMEISEIQSTFLEAAKNASLSPEEVMTGTYVLFGVEASKQYAMMVGALPGYEHTTRTCSTSWINFFIFVGQHRLTPTN